MNILVDTCVWSTALRGKGPHVDPFVAELAELIHEVRACLIGPIRQELLSGIREAAQFKSLRQRLKPFPDIETCAEDFERAAEIFNLCRSRGIQGASTDFLICAVADRRALPILTSDADFKLYARHAPIKLHQPRGLH